MRTTPRVPWLLRVCPESRKSAVLRTGIVVGYIGYMVYLFAGLSAMLVGPLAFARSEPDAPISKLVIWFRGLFPGTFSFMMTYILIVFLVAWILLIGMTIFDYARFQTTPDNSAQPTGGREK